VCCSCGLRVCLLWVACCNLSVEIGIWGSRSAVDAGCGIAFIVGCLVEIEYEYWHPGQQVRCRCRLRNCLLRVVYLASKFKNEQEGRDIWGSRCIAGTCCMCSRCYVGMSCVFAQCGLCSCYECECALQVPAVCAVGAM